MPKYHDLIFDKKSITLTVKPEIFNFLAHEKKEDFLNTVRICCQRYEDAESYTINIKSEIDFNNSSQCQQFKALCLSLCGQNYEDAADNIAKVKAHLQTLEIQEKHHQPLMRLLLQSCDDGDAAKNLSLPFELGGAFGKAIFCGGALKNQDFLRLWASLNQRQVNITLENNSDYICICITTIFKKKDDTVVGNAAVKMLLTKETYELLPEKEFMRMVFDVEQLSADQQQALMAAFVSHELVDITIQPDYGSFWHLTEDAAITKVDETSLNSFRHS